MPLLMLYLIYYRIVVTVVTVVTTKPLAKVSLILGSYSLVTVVTLVLIFIIRFYSENSCSFAITLQT